MDAKRAKAGAKLRSEALKKTGGERDAHGVTPEMREIAEQLVHPDGDPYENARRMGFYCEQCG
ncbi:MAG: hypothetical protein IJ111_12025 [Eggerthellaceae bacterium]|nr:hypothetical protein [Eggerthellaceae bacterium]